jgi:hypothetical protein
MRQSPKRPPPEGGGALARLLNDCDQREARRSHVRSGGLVEKIERSDSIVFVNEGNCGQRNTREPRHFLRDEPVLVRAG